MSADDLLDVRLTHRVHANLDLQLDFRLSRECGIIFGASGAGKTTLLRLIAGLERPNDATIRLADTVLCDTRAKIHCPLRHRGIGMIFQDDLLFPHLSVAANIRFGLKGQPQARVAARMAEIASLCGVESLLDRGVATLSGGERQRVGLARALAPRPRLLLCDEPFSALDLANRHALVERLRSVQKAEAIPVLYVTHSPAEAIALGSQLFWLGEGRIAARGNPLDVLAARHKGEANRLEGILNILRGRVEGEGDGGETRLRLHDGPALIIPAMDRTVGEEVAVEVRADDILLAHGEHHGLSAQNLIPGRVDRVVVHGHEAEVLVRTGAWTWVVSVVTSAVASLGLDPGVEVNLIIKARSCRVLDEGWPEE